MAVEKSSENKPAADTAVQDKAEEKTVENRPAADAPAEGKAATAPAGSETSVDDFARLVANMSRLLSGFGQLKPLRGAGLGLGEWLALDALARQESITSKQMGQRLGIPVQRVAQVFLSLAEKGLISIGQPAEDAGEEGKAANVIKVTDAGKIKLEAVNSEMKAVLAGVVKARSLSGALKQMKPLGRIVRASTPKRSNKSKKKAKQAKGTSKAVATPPSV